MAFDKDAGMTANDNGSLASRDAWVKPEILSFEPVAAAQSSGAAPGDGVSNQS